MLVSIDQGYLYTARNKKTHNTPYHPQSDKLVERLNRTFLSMLATTIKDYGEERENHLAKCALYATPVCTNLWDLLHF